MFSCEATTEVKQSISSKQDKAKRDRESFIIRKTHVGKKCDHCMHNHDLGNCVEFLKKTSEERKIYVFSKRLCFSTIGEDHIAKELV